MSEGFDINKPMCGVHLTDEQVAVKVRMLMRNDLDHEAVCLMSRDRIMCLSHEVKQLKYRLECVNELLNDGFDEKEMEYNVQAVNQAHRVASGGPMPRKTDLQENDGENTASNS